MWTKPGDIPKKFALTPEELDHVETCDSDEEQRRFLEQIVIDKDLPVAMRTIQVRNAGNKQNNKWIDKSSYHRKTRRRKTFYLTFLFAGRCALL